jgi:hypothetical protein
VARGVLAAQLGDVDTAFELLARGIEHGGMSYFGADGLYGIGTLYDVILLQPLLGDPRFRALADPDPRDRP